MIAPTIELRGLDEMQRKLETLSARAVPYAARETLNGLAFAGRAIWQEQMRASLMLRNSWTTRRALVDKARGSRLPDMEALLGHTEEYVRRLEEGIGEHATGSAIAIPTETASGQAKGTLRAGRKRPVRPALIIRVLGKIRRQPGSLPRKGRNARAVQDAIRNGSRLAYLDFERRKGIYQIRGGRKNPKVLKLYDLTRTSTPRPRIPTLQRTIDLAIVQGPTLALAALTRQLERYRIGK